MHSSRGRLIRPTPKMTQMMSEFAQRQGRRLGVKVFRDTHENSPRPAQRGVDAWLKMQQELEEEIRSVELDISQREAEMRRRGLGQTTSTPESVSTSEKMDRYFQVIDTMVPDDVGAHAQVTPQGNSITRNRLSSQTEQPQKSINRQRRGRVVQLREMNINGWPREIDCSGSKMKIVEMVILHSSTATGLCLHTR